MKKIVVWFVGSNATGKTTQAAMIHSALGGRPELIVEGKVEITAFDFSINLGKFIHPITGGINGDSKTLECCGTDRLSTKANIIASFEKALSLPQPIIVIEGIMATGTWIDFVKREDTFVILIHFDIDIKQNIRRLRKRRAEKKGVLPKDIVFEQKTVENLERKLQIFESLYRRLYPIADCATQFKAIKNPKEIHKAVMFLIEDIALKTITNG